MGWGSLLGPSKPLYPQVHPAGKGPPSWLILGSHSVSISRSGYTNIEPPASISKPCTQPDGKSFSPTVWGCSLDAFVLISSPAAIDGLLLVPTVPFCTTLLRVS